jgi:hypothetical protein
VWDDNWGNKDNQYVKQEIVKSADFWRRIIKEEWLQESLPDLFDEYILTGGSVNALKERDE